MASLRDYASGLERKCRERYYEKLRLIDNEDPYEIDAASFSDCVDLFPKISYPDIVNYLVFTVSAYTLEEVKNYKSLQAYNQFLCGWVRDVKVKVCPSGNIVLLGKVLHSQRLNDSPLTPWIISCNGGKILAGHCNCMAGLGETCTHVGAMLFAVESIVKIRDSKSVTEEKAYWVLPPSLAKVPYSQVSEIDFSSPQSKRQSLNNKIGGSTDESDSKKTKREDKIAEPSGSEIEDFFRNLYKSSSKPVILSLVPPYSKDYVPKSLNKVFPQVLTDLVDPSTFQLSFSDLLEICSKINVTVSESESEAVEKETKEQCKSAVWFRFRSGRITASKMKNVCHSNSDLPSQSLIRQICYPEQKVFSTTATRWGCDHENIAVEAYVRMQSGKHSHFSISKSGFIISIQLPFIGASPDSVVSCSCCGTGFLEVKCPYCIRQKTVPEGMANNSFCLEEKGGSRQLKRDHAYFYQVQTQLHVSQKASYVDFMVWTKKDIFIERILADRDFWKGTVVKSKAFFEKCVLPELVGKFYTTVDTTDTFLPAPLSDHDKLWCYCNGLEEDNRPMIYCESKQCRIKWFHADCLKISSIPKGHWYCPDCRKLTKYKKAKLSHKGDKSKSS